MNRGSFWKFWPRMDSRTSAIQSMGQGTFAAGFSCVATAIFAITSIVLKHPIAGIDGLGLVDSAMFAFIAWRISRLSLTWSVLGLLIYAGEQLGMMISNPAMKGYRNPVMFIILLLCYVNAIRGAWFLRKNPEPPLESPVESHATPS